jgi:hypothetical protein
MVIRFLNHDLGAVPAVARMLRRAPQAAQDSPRLSTNLEKPSFRVGLMPGKTPLSSAAMCRDNGNSTNDEHGGDDLEILKEVRKRCAL